MAQTNINETAGITANLAHQSWPDDVTIDELANAQRRAKAANDEVGRLEMELMRRATERGATTIYGKDMKFEIKQQNEYDRTQLPALVEFLTPTQKDKCVTPAYVKAVQIPETHDMTQWKKAARENGGELAKGLEAATFPGPAKGKLVATGEADAIN